MNSRWAFPHKSPQTPTSPDKPRQDRTSPGKASLLTHRNPMTFPTPVAIYGLGNMGYPIAERIRRDFPTQVADLDHTRVEKARALFGAAPMGRPQDLADTRVVVLCLPSPASSLSVI